ncbi:MAG: ABC transporter substrate-binding protein [Silicimonas sp.]|nr:ABC transporter substrate-binding protein [Silicimonas sp.]
MPLLRTSLALALSLTLGAGSSFAAEETVTAPADDNAITFAQVAAFEGQAGALGKGMRDGILAAFEEANRAGGIHGRPVRLETFDDGYEPDRSIEHVRKAIATSNYIGLIGPVGTPTSKATQPLATEAEMPFVGAFTGAGFLRNAELTNVINVRATYGAETEAWIAHLVDDLGMRDIALLYQDDGFGKVGLNGVTAALDRRDMKLVATGTYMRNTTAVKSALLDIRKAKPDAVVMVGAYRPIAEFIKVARQIEFNPTFVNISFVGSRALADELRGDGEGVIISQVVPYPWDTSLPVVDMYLKALKAVNETAEPGFVTLEGYLVGRVALRILDAAGPDADRAAFLAAMGTLGHFDIGGLTFTYGEGDNQGLDTVFLTRITDGGFEPVAKPRQQASR